MKTTLLMTLGTLIGTCLIASAQDAKPERPARGNRGFGGPPPPEMIAKYDADKDGKLNAEESAAMRKAMQEERLAKYDKNKDGKIDDEERKAEMADREAAMIKKFDKDGDGKLSEEEKAAMPKRPGGPGGRRGGAPGAPGGPPPAPGAPPPAPGAQ